MSNFNEVTLIGRLGQQPKVIKGGDKPSFMVCKLVTNEYWKHNNQKNTHTEWHTIEIGEPFAGFIAQYVNVGDELFVRGRLRTRKWENKEGAKFSATVIKADNVQLLRKKSEKTENAAEEWSDEKYEQRIKEYSCTEDDPSLHDKLVEAFKESD